MSFEMNGISYDLSTKKAESNKLYYLWVGDATKGVKKTFVPVPYNLGFELSVMQELKKIHFK